MHHLVKIQRMISKRQAATTTNMVIVLSNKKIMEKKVKMTVTVMSKHTAKRASSKTTETRATVKRLRRIMARKASRKHTDVQQLTQSA